MQIVTIAE